MNNIIIIGGGIAAVNAIKAIRETNPDVEIDLFGEENFYPYFRLKLSKCLLDKPEEDSLLLQKKDWYEMNKINLHLNVRVQGLDIKRQEITLSQEKRMHYDKLLLANGACNRPLTITGADGRKTNTIRNLEDLQKLRGILEDKQIILYIGGGVLGLEIAWVLQQHHKQVVIAEIQNRLFPYQLDERAAVLLKNRVESFGVKVLTGAEVVNIIGDQAAEGFEMKDGSKFPCETVLYSTGIRPNIDIVKGTTIKTNRGVIVDDQMQTNIADVYAAGDVAEHNGKVYGLWNAAAEQGKTAGYNMVNRTTFYQPSVPVTFLNAYGISLFSMGEVAETGDTRTLIEEDPARDTYRRIFIRNQAIVGAIIIGDTGKSSLLKTAIEQKLPLERIDYQGITMDQLLERIKTLKN
jgi:NAD(P)H-nitrite reductase